MRKLLIIIILNLFIYFPLSSFLNLLFTLYNELLYSEEDVPVNVYKTSSHEACILHKETLCEEMVHTCMSMIEDLTYNWHVYDIT